MYPDNYFSALKQVRQSRSKDAISTFYDHLLHPLTLCLGSLAIVGLVWSSLPINDWLKIYEQDLTASFILLLLLVSCVAGVRIIQSIYLAQIDYKDMEHSIGDIVTFATVLAFLSGTFIKWLHATPLGLLIVYVGFCSMAAWNFLTIYTRRISPHSKQFDYQIERLVQALNSIVFVALLVIFIIILVRFWINERFEVFDLYLLASIVPFLVLNIFHSHHLTFYPKLQITNEPLRPENLYQTLEGFGEPVSLAAQALKRSRAMRTKIESTYNHIELRRATKSDVTLLIDCLIAEFGYMFFYLLGTDDKEKVHHVLSQFLRSGFGLGQFGFKRFYLIMSEQEAVGFVKIETSREPWLYSLLGAPRSWHALVSNVGLVETFRSLSRISGAKRAQPAPREHELRLTYIVIFEANRRRGLAKSTLALLELAFLRSYSINGLKMNRISLYARQENTSANDLFQAHGFKPGQNYFASSDDAAKISQTKGDAMFMELSI